MAKDAESMNLRLPISKNADADEVMFEACFAALGRFVEKELGTKSWPQGPELYRGYRLHCDGDEKAIDLWLWYKEELPALKEAVSRDWTECNCRSEVIPSEPGDPPGSRRSKIVLDREPLYPYDHIETVKDEKLRELIDIRRSLWT